MFTDTITAHKAGKTEINLPIKAPKTALSEQRGILR